MHLKCKVNLFHHHNWIRGRDSVSFQITFEASESVISSDNNTSCVFMRETARSPMHNTFTPDSDSVYLAKGAVSLHDNVVTDGINARATHDIHSGHDTWEQGPQTMWRWSHDSGKESWCFFLRKIAGYHGGCQVTSGKWMGGCIFPSAEYSKHFAKHATLNRAHSRLLRLPCEVPSCSSGQWYRQTYSRQLLNISVLSCSHSHTHTHGASTGSKQTSVFPSRRMLYFLKQPPRRKRRKRNRAGEEIERQERQ